MPSLLALDAGGTTTRAVALDGSGRPFGHGRAGSGNPTAVGVEAAVEAIAGAATAALGAPPTDESVAVIAMAGEQSSAFAAAAEERLAPLGVRRVVLEHDLLATYYSGTVRPAGYAVIAGTGSVAASIREGRLARVVGGRGWLLGDAGSGFWTGRRVARAVVADLDGQGPATTLTPAVLAAFDVPADLGTVAGRTAALRGLITAAYASPPVRLATLAPLALGLAQTDPVTRQIVRAAARALADLVAAVRADDAGGADGPVVAGGSFLVRGLLDAPADLAADLPPLVPDGVPLLPVPDGLLGAAVLALRHAGVAVDDDAFAALRADLSRITAG